MKKSTKESNGIQKRMTVEEVKLGLETFCGSGCAREIDLFRINYKFDTIRCLLLTEDGRDDFEEAVILIESEAFGLLTFLSIDRWSSEVRQEAEEMMNNFIVYREYIKKYVKDNFTDAENIAFNSKDWVGFCMHNLTKAFTRIFVGINEGTFKGSIGSITCCDGKFTYSDEYVTHREFTCQTAFEMMVGALHVFSTLHNIDDVNFEGIREKLPEMFDSYEKYHAMFENPNIDKVKGSTIDVTGISDEVLMAIIDQVITNYREDAERPKRVNF